jgi:hypothetical protein
MPRKKNETFALAACSAGWWFEQGVYRIKPSVGPLGWHHTISGHETTLKQPTDRHIHLVATEKGVAPQGRRLWPPLETP